MIQVDNVTTTIDSCCDDGCCGGTTAQRVAQPDKETITAAVHDRYAKIAAAGGNCCDDDGFGTSAYEQDLTALPAEVTALSLGCGDPLAIAQLQAGQHVLDLGSGGGIDCFLAAQKVGAEGRVIGVDMTEEMIERANTNRAKMGADNVEFRLGHIEQLPIEDNAIDVIISNCVINLSGDKPAVIREAFRVLRPGGRFAVSDMVTLGRFNEQQWVDLAAWSGCIAGAEEVSALVDMLRDSGFENVAVFAKDAPDVNLAGQQYAGEPRLFSAYIRAQKPNSGSGA